MSHGYIARLMGAAHERMGEGGGGGRLSGYRHRQAI